MPLPDPGAGHRVTLVGDSAVHPSGEDAIVLSQSGPIRLLESLRSAEGLELVRSIAERIMQELIEAEVTAKIDAEWNAHTEARTNYRNGHCDKTLTTQAGDLDLAVPKLRSGSFSPSLLEPRRIDQTLYAGIMEAYVEGAYTRSVDDLVRALGADTGISKSEVTKIGEGLDEPLTAFRARPMVGDSETGSGRNLVTVTIAGGLECGVAGTNSARTSAS